MFGHVQANFKDLSESEQQRYRSAYCGLCRTLGNRHGLLSRLSLTYDLTFLAILLSSLYEPEEQTGECRCCIHPCKKHSYAVNKYTEYAADMTIALAYYKCLDDWNDEKKVFKKFYADILHRHYEDVKERWPRQCAAIEQCLEALSDIEQNQQNDPDAGAKCFGTLMGELFAYEQDHWESSLRKLGFGLGEYIYLADAVEDLEKDRKHGNYNPLNSLNASPKEMRSTLSVLLGEASQAFEFLPLLQDAHLLRNILYSGIWIKYNRATQEREKT